jgi:hypothetical protein
MEPTDRAIAILEQMIAMTKTNQEKMEATDFMGNPEEMECESEHREVPKEDVVVKPVKGRKKRHRGGKLAARRRGGSKEFTRGDCGSRGSWLPPAGRCPVVKRWHGARETSSGKFGPGDTGDPGVTWPPPE